MTQVEFQNFTKAENMSLGKYAISLSKIECAEVLKTLRTALPEQEYSQVKQYLITTCSEADENAIESAIQGISEEDEFLLMSYLMGTVTHLVPLFQRPVIKKNYIVPDFLGSFQAVPKISDSSNQDLLKYFIDVKSTSKDKCKIGGSRLKRLREFSDHFQLPLLLAVRFTIFPKFPAWALVEDTDRSKTSITIRLQDIMNGNRKTIWNDYWFSLRQSGVSFKATFTSKNNQSSQKSYLSHRTHGELQQFDIKINDLILTCNDKLKATLRYMFFEHLSQEDNVIREGSMTTQILKPKMLIRSVADMVSHFNRLGRDDIKTSSAANQILIKIAHSNDKTIINREVIESLIQPMIRVRLLEEFVYDSSMTISRVQHEGWEELMICS